VQLVHEVGSNVHGETAFVGCGGGSYGHFFGGKGAGILWIGDRRRCIGHDCYLLGMYWHKYSILLGGMVWLSFVFMNGRIFHFRVFWFKISLAVEWFRGFAPWGLPPLRAKAI